MSVLSLFCLCIWLVLLPTACGLLFADVFGRRNRGIGTVFLCGYLFMMAAFQIFYLPFLLWYNHFWPLVCAYAAFVCVFAACSAWRKKKEIAALLLRLEKPKAGVCCLWGLALFLIGIQIYKAVCYQYPDHDDAFYAVVSVMTDANNTMYQELPYTGETSGPDVRHAFSGHPVWIAFLARVCGIHPTIVLHTVFPAAVIVLAYVLMKKTGDMLLAKHREYVPVFLCFISLMQIFGNATIYTAATFFLTRTSQGKALLGSIALPAAFLGILYAGRLLAAQKYDRAWRMLGVYMAMVFLVGAYCSAMGMFLLPLMTGGAALLYALLYKKAHALALCALSLLPTLLLGGVYYMAMP